jgi:hypothetical protein
MQVQNRKQTISTEPVGSLIEMDPRQMRIRRYQKLGPSRVVRVVEVIKIRLLDEWFLEERWSE